MNDSVLVEVFVLISDANTSAQPIIGGVACNELHVQMRTFGPA